MKSFFFLYVYRCYNSIEYWVIATTQIKLLAAKDETSGPLLAHDCESKGLSDALVVRQMVCDSEDI